MLKIGHSVTRPGRNPSDKPVTIKVPEELETVPGTVQNPRDVDFYSREYPLEHVLIQWTADQDWRYTVLTKESREDWEVHVKLTQDEGKAPKSSGEIEPTVGPVSGKDVTKEIKAKARELGFGEVGITKFDRRYIYQYKKDWAKHPHVICLAYEQDYEATQATPDRDSEAAHQGTYRVMGEMALELANYIRGLGYHAQIHPPTGSTTAYIPLCVEAGMGQLGANGQLLSPHFGSRARLMLISTDAVVTYDGPVDYGINGFCNLCQVCVNRCPGRALMRDRVWWRGVSKHKLIYKRCRPVMERYEDCGVCMKVCPIQRYGMKPVMEHYIATGQVLGKGTDLLEGYELRDLGYFGPGQLPTFDTEFFQFPHGRSEDLAFEELKEKIKAGEVPDDAHGDVLLREFKRRVEQHLNADGVESAGPVKIEKA